jgi:hypothetical protein
MVGDMVASHQTAAAHLALRAQPPDHHPADRDHADRRHLCVLRRPLADREQPPHRRPRRGRLLDTAELRGRPQPGKFLAPGRSRPAHPRTFHRFQRGRRPAARTAPVPVRRGRPVAAAGAGRPSRPTLLVRLRPLPRLCGCQGQGAGRGSAHHSAQGQGLRDARPHLHFLDDHSHRGADDDRRGVHPQPGACDRTPGRRRRCVRQGRGPRFPAAWRARGAPGRRAPSWR